MRAEDETGIHELTIPQIGFIAATRAAAGLGIGLLISDRFSRTERIALGCILITIGAVTTVPILMRLLKEPELAQDA
jgi:hypothetical protein